MFNGIARLLYLSVALSLLLPAAGEVNFDRDVRPILSDKCFACHGPDDQKRMANLRLDTAEGVFSQRGKRPASVTPGDAEASLLYQRIAAEDPQRRMPPLNSHLELNTAEIDVLKRWIDSGANYEVHWAYSAPQRPTPPAVSNQSWTRNPIDHFVLARLEKEGLTPAPAADQTTLLRRVHLDLTGLPPTPAQVRAFLQDQSPRAYERVVDELLASPHFGERMTMQWLDLARYADTHGYHIDSVRQMHHWRDWVITAFNQNKPFDRFIVEQIAGDLLPNPTGEQLIATGFNRNHMINFEGGAIPEEYQTEYVVDRVETTSTVFLGLTMGCARCHDHKYDPMKQKDFYRFFAFFNTIPEKGLDGQKGNAAPFLRLPSPQQEHTLEQVKAAIKRTNDALPAPEIEQAMHRWERTALETMPALPTRGLTHYFGFENKLEDSSGGSKAKTVRGEVLFLNGRIGRAADLSGETHISLGGAGAFTARKPFSLSLFVRPQKRYAHAILQRIDPATRAGWELWTDDAELLDFRIRGAHLIFRMRDASGGERAVRMRNRVLLKDWLHVTVASGGSGQAHDIRFYVDGKEEPVEVLSGALKAEPAPAASLSIGDKSLGRPFKGGIDELRFYDRALSAEEAASLALHSPARALVAIGPEERNCEQNEELKAYYLTEQARKEWKQAWADLGKLRKQRDELEETIPTSMVMREMPEPRDTFLLARGDYRNKTEKVTPQVPGFLPPMPADAPPNRLGLAQWLVSPENPLTARVTVNRFWQMLFGSGIVETSEDFGSQGASPSHPELLDWLAVEFVESGWDVKALMKRIVTSAAYRQSSAASPELIEHDPENRLLARGPRFRMPAEMLRDHALAASGLLNARIGGPSVYPYQPPGLWEEMAYGDGFTGQEYTQSKGEDLYRRTMYTFWKRTVPPPTLSTFDAPDREKCTARRARTNTPLQALVLLNDPTYVEAARALAARVIEKAGPDPGARIKLAFQYATARQPTPNELQVLRDAAETEAAYFHKHPQRAGELLKIGEHPANGKVAEAELAAWTTVASIILNLDEAVTKE